ncbi:MAG: hypothetical protein RJQ21_01945 [Rhodospirillales bacterium]
MDQMIVSPVPSVGRNARTSAIEPHELERQRIRVKEIIDRTGGVEELAINGMRPPPNTPFAFVAMVPSVAKHLRGDLSARHRCSYCQTSNKFLNGRIVICGDGELRLIGNDCWNKHISEEDWRIARNDFADWQRRKKFEEVSGEYPEVLDRLASSIKYSIEKNRKIFSFVSGMRSNLRNSMPELLDALDEANEKGGVLEIEERVLDIGALEGRRGQIAAQEKESKPQKFRSQVRIIHRLRGREAIVSAYKNPHRNMEKALSLVWKAKRDLSETEWSDLDNRQFSRSISALEKTCKEAVDLIKHAKICVESAASFMSFENLSGVVRWASHQECLLSLYADYSVVPNGLVFVPENGSPAKLVAPDIVSLEIDGLAEMEILLRR